MKIVYRKSFAAASLAAAAILTVSACSNDTSTSASPEITKSTVAAASAAPAPMERSMDPRPIWSAPAVPTMQRKTRPARVR